MRHRIFVDRIEPQTIVRGDEFHHVRVVRLREGEEVELFDRTGALASAVIAKLGRDEAVIEVQKPLPSRESPIDVHLAMALIQLERFELVLQKATELGIRSIVPLVTERIELRRERYAGKLDRWKKIVFEAVKQSGRSVVPSVEEPVAFAEAIARPGAKVFFDADEQPSENSVPGPATLFIGPEGGWSAEEIEGARLHGARFQRLGPRRLRAETAAIVAAARYVALVE